jgi:nitrite reductase/ring-hydroxylating ferredoxin subunit
MGHAYQAVGWNPAKKRYDKTLLQCVLAGLVTFGGITALLRPDSTAETILIRSFGFVAFALLHVILSIGPLCRLDARFLPLLYNRRHMGVTMFFCALAHGTLSFVLYHALGVISPLESLFLGDSGGVGIAGIPFQPLGAFALAILFLMAATSHDFWLRNLTAPVWKTLHMLVYAAYGMLVMHVALGYLQSNDSATAPIVVLLGMAWLIGVHLAAARKEALNDRPARAQANGAFVDVCSIDDIPEKGARTAMIAGERVAVFRYDGCVSAVSSVCKHQNGPLGEGRIQDGCIVCPWHGYQYRPQDGRAPSPFTETLPTFGVKVEAGRVLVASKPNAPGTHVEPARVEGAGKQPDGDFYVGYGSGPSTAQSRFSRRVVVRAFAVCIAALALLAATQRQLRDSRFEFGVVRAFTGKVEMTPYPVLRVARPNGGASAWMLVAPGKHGADDLVQQFAGRAITLRGSLIHQGERTMIEVEPGSVTPLDAAASSAIPSVQIQRHGRMTLRGEIVDSKCHLGVMNPGERRTHRACAKLCIRGGIPPMLWCEDKDGNVRRLLLVDLDGRAVNDRVVELVGDPVEMDGDVTQIDDILLLRIDPALIRRL